MFTIKKYIIGIIIGTMIFSGIAIVDDLIIKISMGLAASIAFSLVGFLYTAGLISSKAEGGKARFSIFIILLCFFLFVFTQIVKGVMWLFSFPIWLYITIICIGAVTLTIVMIIKNRKVKTIYSNTSTQTQNISYTNIEQSKVEEVVSQIDTELKTIQQLLLEEKVHKFILATTNNLQSPGLQYVKVYKSALNYPTIKGYIKMDHAAAFWGDVYYAYEKRWIKYT